MSSRYVQWVGFEKVNEARFLLCVKYWLCWTNMNRKQILPTPFRKDI
jgi:hypothetical protein